MDSNKEDYVKSRQKTLLASLLLSLWAPLTTGIAMSMNNSATQVADFIRRTMELFVLLLSWLVFRYLTQNEELTEDVKKKWEKIVNASVAVVLGASGLIMLSLALFRTKDSGPRGNVSLGLIIAILGFAVNFCFWQRYSILVSKDYSLIIDAQRQLYLAKVFVDICVIFALGAIALMPTCIVTRYIDILGSIAVSLYLLWSAYRTWNIESRT